MRRHYIVVLLAVIGIASAGFADDDVFEILESAGRPQARQQEDEPDIPQPQVQAIREVNAEAEQLFQEMLGTTFTRHVPAGAALAVTEAPTPIENDMAAIIQHCQSLPVSERITTRYLDLSSAYPQERRELYTVTSFVLNSLSWGNQIVMPQIVPGSDNKIVYFNFTWYSRTSTDVQRWINAWESMTAHDPYFLEPWVDHNEAATLANLTGSVGAVLRADWFDFYSMQQDDKATTDTIEGFYSDFLGLPGTEAELFSLLHVREDEIQQFSVDRRGMVVQSGTGSNAVHVAFNNRYVNRYPTITKARDGYLYFTQDFFNSSGDRNVFNDPLTDTKDGGEYIFSLPNGLQGYYLTAHKVDGHGNDVFEQVSEVPIQIASSQFSHRRVKYNTCTHCHVNGINSYRDMFEDGLLRIGEPGGMVQITEANPNTALRARQLYASDTAVFVQADQIGYTSALLQATGGVSANEFVTMWKSVYERYEAPLTPNRAAWEFGTADLQAYLGGGSVSTTQGALLLLLKALPDEPAIQRDTFEVEYQNGKLLRLVEHNITAKAEVDANISMQVPAVVVGNLVETSPYELQSARWRIRGYPSARQHGSSAYYPSQSEDPLDTETLLRWVQEGRIDATTELWRVGSDQWVRAADILPDVFGGE